MNKLTRRAFMAIAGRGCPALLAAGLMVAPPAGRGYRRLSGEQAEMLLAAAHILIPPPKGAPSFSDVALLGYIDGLLETAAERDALSQGLAALDAAARSGYGRGFLRLERAEQAKLLRSGDELFFRSLRAKLVEAYFSNPLVWKFIGFGGRSQFTGYPDYHHWPQK